MQNSRKLGNKQLVKDNLESLSIAWEGLQDFQKSLEYYKLYDSVSDSLLNEQNKKNIEEINIKYKTEKKDPEKAEDLSEQSLEILDEIHDEIRNIAFNLMPKVLLNEGLIAATRALINKINKSGEIKIESSVFDIEDRFQEKSAISLYRIIQEFLSNIIKYSQAKKLDIQFTGYDTEIVLTIEDDGPGYDLEKFKSSEGNGWRNINTRLEMLNANMEIDTLKGRNNSTVIITIPKHGNLKL